MGWLIGLCARLCARVCAPVCSRHSNQLCEELTSANIVDPSSAYQIDASQTSVFFVSDQPALRSTALSAADSINFPRSRIVLLQSPQTIRAQLVANFGQAAPRVNGLLTLAGLVEAGRAAIAGARDQPAEMDKGRRRLADGEPARKAAFLSFEEDR